MANYPDWVMKHKKKGTYINKVGDKYYLYAAHSERVPGTNKVRRVSDGYLGRITEADGFIPAKRKLSGRVYVFEFGLSETILKLCSKIRNGLNREFRANGDFVMAGGAMLFMFGEIRPEYYATTWLSERFSGFGILKVPTEKQRFGMERTQRMISDTLKSYFGDDYALAVSLLPLIKVVCMGDEKVLAAIPGIVSDFLEKYGLSFELEVKDE